MARAKIFLSGRQIQPGYGVIVQSALVGIVLHAGQAPVADFITHIQGQRLVQIAFGGQSLDMGLSNGRIGEACFKEDRFQSALQLRKAVLIGERLLGEFDGLPVLSGAPRRE